MHLSDEIAGVPTCGYGYGVVYQHHGAWQGPPDHNPFSFC
jgi:hypothetical protein